MTREEAYEITRQMGAHPYSIDAMTDALMKGCEIGKKEQNTIDTKKATKAYCELCETHSYCVVRGIFYCYETEYIRKAMEETK